MIRTILANGDAAMTRKELRDALQVNEARFKAVLEEGEEVVWSKEGGKGTAPETYRLVTG